MKNVNLISLPENNNYYAMLYANHLLTFKMRMGNILTSRLDNIRLKLMDAYTYNETRKKL